ncbi:MAG: hypothetical protein ABI277_03680 [Burkholderiaceae bacterium]
MHRSFRHLVSCALATAAVASAFAVGAQAETAKGPAPGSLGEQFPSGSIDSVARADAALAMTSGARAHVELEYKADARACLKVFLVNDCIDKARELQRDRLVDIETVELEANRYKRRDKADRLDADRAKREAERAANAKADDDVRARNRKTFEERQDTSVREAEVRKRSEAIHALPPKPHKSAIKVAPPAITEIEAKQRQKNAADHALKVQEADAHMKDIDRRALAKAADRKRRAEEKAAKDAKATAAAAAPPKS